MCESCEWRKRNREKMIGTKSNCYGARCIASEPWETEDVDDEFDEDALGVGTTPAPAPAMMRAARSPRVRPKRTRRVRLSVQMELFGDLDGF